MFVSVFVFEVCMCLCLKYVCVAGCRQRVSSFEVWNLEIGGQAVCAGRQGKL